VVVRIEDDTTLRVSGPEGHGFFVIMLVEEAGGSHTLRGTHYEAGGRGRSPATCT
jgi:hypothetical protein